MEFYIPNLYKIFVNDVILGKKLSKLSMVIGGYLLAFAVTYLVDYGKILSKYKVVNTVLYRIRKSILERYFSFTFAECEKVNIGDLKMRIDDDTEKIREFAYEQTSSYWVEWIKLIVSIILLFQINKQITILMLLAVPVTFYIDNILSKNEKKVLEVRRSNLKNLTSWMHASVTGWRETKALNLGKSQLRIFCRYWHNEMLIYAKWINYWTARVLIVPKIKNDFLMRFVLYLLGGILIMNKSMTIGDLLVFAVYYSIFYNAAQNISSLDAGLQSKMPFIDRLMEYLIEPCQIRQSGILPGDSGSIELQSVSFSYEGTNDDVFTDFSIVIPKGERIAFVGSSGSGKTTLLKLITGMVSPKSGHVLYSGIDLQDIDLEYMHRRIGFVMQENILFNLSIRENLLFGKQDATEKELEEACRKACIYDFISELTYGFDTVIGDRGMKLSGGQRQRLILARLFLREVDVFIFDEATSALDQYSESIVHDAILNISRDKTIIVVSHRESSLQLCDRIVEISPVSPLPTCTNPIL
ncbi:MAG: ABC transporter ATP-binding protein [Lachnospiraceae bacterium]|nr:ABC transporter ATP-binding protein [Lachnospiraceae bacterium]